MRKRRARVRQLVLFAAADTAGVAAGLCAAYALRFYGGFVEVTKEYSPGAYARLLPAAVAVWLFYLQAMGCYDFSERAFNLQILRKVFRASLLAVMTIVAFHFFARTQEFSRLVYPLAVVTVTAGVGVARLGLDRALARLRRSGRFPVTNVALLGVNPLAAELARRIRNHAYLGLRVKGFIAAQGADAGGAEGFAVLGGHTEARRILREHDIAEIIVADPGLTPAQILDFAYECEKENASVRVVPNILQAKLVEVEVEQIDGIPLFGLRDTPLDGWNIVAKRAFDMAVSAAGLVALSPVFAALAAAVRLTSPGRVFYKQRRVGLDGRRFNIYKFRSMRDGAPDDPARGAAAPDDPRVTPLGRWMRRNNLDELPQLWNVLRGDMSLVGPRPERPEFVVQFREQIPRYMGRHRVRCGITGWAQVNGLRQNTSMDERIRHDLFYIENWSFWLDLKILFMTVRARKNAY